MIYADYHYIGWKSDVRSRTSLMDLNDPDPGFIACATEDIGSELYQSIYRFDDKILAYSSLADLADYVTFYSDYLVFDFDKEGDVDAALRDAQHLKAALDKMGAVSYVYFSGHKGFHILVPTVQFGFEPTNDHTILKRMAEQLATRYATFDPSIYNATRIFRVPGSLNAKSGLYKIPLENFTSLASSDILAAAKERPDWDHSVNLTTLPKVPILVRLYEICKPRVNRVVQASEPREFGTLLKSAAEGNRNVTLYQISRDFARRAVPENDMVSIGQWWNKTLKSPMDDEEVRRTVRSAYTKGVNDIVQEDNLFNHIFTAKRSLAELRETYKNFSQNVVSTGFDFLDEYTLGFLKQEVTFLISRFSNFKTAVLSGLMRGISHHTKKPCLYFSMEQGKDQMTIRHIQTSEGLSQLQAFNGLKNGADFPLYESDWSNVHMVYLSALNTDKVLQFIDKFMEQYGEIGALGFDYLSLFEGCANDTARTARQATELKTRIAKAGNCPVFCLVQAKREYQGNEGDCEIDASAGKDSSSIEDSADYLLGQWGHWVERTERDPVTGDVMARYMDKQIWGRFLKSRKFMSEKYQVNPYYRIDITKSNLTVVDFVYSATPPKFNQKKDYRE